MLLYKSFIEHFSMFFDCCVRSTLCCALQRDNTVLLAVDSDAAKLIYTTKLSFQMCVFVC